MTILGMARLGAAMTAAFALVACGGGSDNSTGSGGAGVGGGTGGDTGGSGGAGGTSSGGMSSGGSGGMTTTTGPFTPAPHPVPPKVLNLGGDVLKSPKVMAITDPKDAFSGDVDKFLTEIASTKYWAETTQEYGVGPITVLPTVHPDNPWPAALTDADVQTLIKTKLSDAAAPWGKPDPETIYLVVLPKGSIVDADGKCCESYDGYHDEISVGGVTVPYAITCTCSGFDGPKVTDLQELTVVISHELVEAATDPYPQSSTGYGQTDDDDAVWTITTGGEVEDMCAFNLDSLMIPQGSQYMVQRSWSNKAAAEGKNPCLPDESGEPYFNSAPVLPDTVTLNYYGPWKTKGIQVPSGTTKTIDVQLFSEAPTSGPWKVTAFDYASAFEGGAPRLELSLDKDMGQNGDTLKLTIKNVKPDGNLKGEIFVIQSDLGKQSNLWFGVVGN